MIVVGSVVRESRLLTICVQLLKFNAVVGSRADKSNIAFGNQCEVSGPDYALDLHYGGYKFDHRGNSQVSRWQEGNSSANSMKD